MKTSARNKFDGKITKLEPLGIIVNVELETKDGLVIKSQITETSRMNLDLKPEKHCSAIVKAPLVHMAPAGNCDKKLENCFEGTIEKINSDAHATEVLGTIGKDHKVCALFAKGAKMPFEAKAGDKVRFCFGADSVIIVD